MTDIATRIVEAIFDQATLDGCLLKDKAIARVREVVAAAEAEKPKTVNVPLTSRTIPIYEPKTGTEIKMRYHEDDLNTCWPMPLHKGGVVKLFGHADSVYGPIAIPGIEFRRKGIKPQDIKWDGYTFKMSDHEDVMYVSRDDSNKWADGL